MRVGKGEKGIMKNRIKYLAFKWVCMQFQKKKNKARGNSTATNYSIFRLPVALPGKHPLTTLMRSNFGHDGRCWSKNLPTLAADFE